MFVTHVSLLANSYIVETGVSMDPYKYETKRVLEVTVRGEQVPHKGNLKATIQFVSGKFQKVSYDAVTPYCLETWKFLGELSQLVQDMQAIFDNKGMQAELTKEIMAIQPEAFRV